MWSLCNLGKPITVASEVDTIYSELVNINTFAIVEHVRATLIVIEVSLRSR